MNPARRDLLKFSPLALAAFMPSLASAQVTGATAPTAPAFFDVRSYGASGTGKLCNILSGIPDFPIRDVKISNFYMQHRGGATTDKANLVPPEEVARYPDPEMFGPMPAQGFFLRHVRNIELSHVEIAPMQADARPSFVLEDVDRADFFAITAPTTPSAFDFRHAKDVRVGWSRAAKDATFADASGKVL